MAGDVGMAQQLARVDVAARAGALGEVERHGEIADLDRPRPVLANVTVHSSDVALEREVSVAVQVRDGARHRDRRPTRHSASATVAVGAIVTSTRIAIVLTGANSTALNALASTPYAPSPSTSFHCDPS